MIAPKISMLMSQGNKPGVVLFDKANTIDAEITITKEQLSLAKGKKSVYVKDVGTYILQQPATQQRLSGKIAVITGSAQGFGKELAIDMANNGAHVVISDLNYPMAQQTADIINNQNGENCAFAIETDVSDEQSVANMIEKTVLQFGGIDILVCNAGVLRAGSLDEMSVESFDFVTNINYKAYFLCVKHASKVMKLQHEVQNDYYMDIIQINSKSGLVGSNKNFAYAGGKFGGIGLTQSFALELIPYNIKVNSICPGNFFDGPLWSNPENGLFVQYLNTGKVPGAKTVEDVKAFYEGKVPMKRGCNPSDVACAMYYVIEQQYETGQAIPVTGGQVMLS
ncbi:MAG: SDR family NAD(P)-dependent oxidoreductase [Clostridiaceae bacterium]|nr:SDR family NAD(P)-dependent oxidoreductase [Clostridiaceae bacterium]